MLAKHILHVIQAENIVKRCIYGKSKLLCQTNKSYLSFIVFFLKKWNLLKQKYFFNFLKGMCNIMSSDWWFQLSKHFMWEINAIWQIQEIFSSKWYISNANHFAHLFCLKRCLFVVKRWPPMTALPGSGKPTIQTQCYKSIYYIYYNESFTTDINHNCF